MKTTVDYRIVKVHFYFCYLQRSTVLFIRYIAKIDVIHMCVIMKVVD